VRCRDLLVSVEAVRPGEQFVVNYVKTVGASVAVDESVLNGDFSHSSGLHSKREHVLGLGIETEVNNSFVPLSEQFDTALEEPARVFSLRDINASNQTQLHLFQRPDMGCKLHSGSKLLQIFSIGEEVVHIHRLALQLLKLPRNQLLYVFCGLHLLGQRELVFEVVGADVFQAGLHANVIMV